MTRNRGNTIAIVLGALVVVAGIVLAVLGYGKAERSAGHASGVTEERLRWQKRHADETARLSADLDAAHRRVADLERKAAAELVELDQEHIEEMRNVKAAHARFMDDLAAGRLRFGAGCAARGDPQPRDEARASAAAGERDGQAGGELPRTLQAAVARGASLAAEADEVVLQLTAAQGTIETYRRTCR